MSHDRRDAANQGSNGLSLAGVNIGTAYDQRCEQQAGTYTVVPPTVHHGQRRNEPAKLSARRHPTLSVPGLSTLSPVYTLITSQLQPVLGPVLQAAGASWGSRGGRPQHQLRRRVARAVSAPVTLLGGACAGHGSRTAPGPADPARARRLGRTVHPGRSRIRRSSPPRHDGSPGQVALPPLSGLLLAYVLHRVGWSPNALPPLLLLVGLVQLAYCDLKRRLLPKTLVYALSVAVIGSGVIVALSPASGNDSCWRRWAGSSPSLCSSWST